MNEHTENIESSTVANYTETFTHFLLQAHFSLMGYPDYDYIMEPISQYSERTEGYDVFVEFEELFTFYMQLKKPSAYLNTSSSSIVSDREGVGLESKPYSLYFDLHRSTDKETDKLINAQHNALYDMTQEGFRVAYVCPLFLFKKNYKAKMQLLRPSKSEILISQLPFSSVEIEIRTKLGQSFPFRDVPMFHHHVSIPPHDKIDDEVHRYSFSCAGNGVCFHSPLNLEELGKPLYLWLDTIYEESLRRAFAPNGSEAKEKFERIRQIIHKWSGESVDLPENLNFEAWKNLGDILRKTLGIEQYGIFRRKKFVEPFRADIGTLFGV